MCNGRVIDFVESLDEIQFVETDGGKYLSVDEFCDQNSGSVSAVLTVVGAKNNVRVAYEADTEVMVRRNDPVENLPPEIATLCE